MGFKGDEVWIMGYWVFEMEKFNLMNFLNINDRIFSKKVKVKFDYKIYWLFMIWCWI